jgi:anti-sigma B factor antagonist
MRAGLGPVADMHAVLQPGHIGPAGSDPASLLPGPAWSAHRRAVRLQDLTRFPGDDRDCLGLGVRLVACDGRLVMGDALTITVRRERGVVIAAVTGDIDISTVTRLRERLFELADSGGTLIVDLNRVTFIDSAGLGALVGAARRAAAHGGSLHAVCARPQTRKLLWRTGVDRRIPLAATVDGALMFLASRDAPG